MSRIGKIPVKIPEDVKVEISGHTISASGPKGQLTLNVPARLDMEYKDGEISLKTGSKNSQVVALHGTFRALIANVIEGVSKGWAKKLELVGTGFRAEVKSRELILTIGFSHPVIVTAPEGITFTVEKNVITVEGIDKAVVGQVSAVIRSKRPPEPYKGKGIIYVGEVVRRKPGKAAKAQGAA